nr:FdtA/QdtA family cupin domain-containing protein [uncultured Blautia sp.]
MSLKEKCPVFYFDVKGDERGQMIVIEGGVDIPFDIKRMFYIYGSDTSVIRGQHANRESEFILINVHGTSKVKLRDGEEEMTVSLDAPMKGIYIPRMIWKDMYDFSEDSVLLVLASTHYIAEEYVRDYDSYVSEACVCK